MSVMVGVRNTDLGVLPYDWSVEELGSLRPFVTSGSRGWARYYADRGASFIRITNLSRGSIYLDLTDLKLVNLPPSDREAPRRRLQAGDLLISITADIGIIGYVDSRVPQPAYINQHIALVRYARSVTDTKFLAYFLASERPQRAFRAATDQGAKAGMNLAGVLRIKAAFPPLPEQEAIAAALSDTDALVTAQDRLIAKKRDLRHAAMQQLLTGKQRLPGFSGAWEVKRLGDIAVLHRDSVLPASSPDQLFVHFSLPAFDSSKLPVVEPGSAIGSNKFRVPQGAILVSKLNPRIPRIWCPDDIPEDGIASTEFLVLMPRESVSRSFLSAVCSSSAFCERMELSATGTTGSHQRINPTDALNIKLCVPECVDEQTAIATVLSDMDAELAALEQQRDKTRAIKQAMMQELLTGRIRLV